MTGLQADLWKVENWFYLRSYYNYMLHKNISPANMRRHKILNSLTSGCLTLLNENHSPPEPCMQAFHMEVEIFMGRSQRVRDGGKVPPKYAVRKKFQFRKETI